jgi:hypothetical protein
MEGAALRIAAVLSLSLGVACSTYPEISFDEREDFSRYRTWDWLPGTARTIDAPAANSVALDHELARFVERALERRGFERVRRRPDLRVGVRLEVRREEVTIYETHAIEQLSSLHSSPSYDVQASVKRRQTYERSRLLVFAIEARQGRVVWEGALAARSRGQLGPHLERTTADLLERFPSAGRASTGAPPPARDPATGRPSEFGVEHPGEASDHPGGDQASGANPRPRGDLSSSSSESRAIRNRSMRFSFPSGPSTAAPPRQPGYACLPHRPQRHDPRSDARSGSCSIAYQDRHTISSPTP